MTEPPYLVPTEWLVVFEPMTSLWWGRFLPEGFGHVYAIGYVPGDPGAWLLVEPLVIGTQVGVIAHEWVQEIFRQAHIGRLRILKARPVGHVAVRPRWVVTCAGCIGSVLGLRRLPLTPSGLFWTLRRLGAVEVAKP